MKGFKLSKFWYYVISFTWGLPMNLIGVICAITLGCLGYKPEKNIYGWYFRIGYDWGGINLGIFSIISKTALNDTKLHEFGHSIQICIFGPFYLVFVAIPSLIRYWYREYLWDVKKVYDLPDYDYAWFEGQATLFGNRYHNLNSKNTGTNSYGMHSHTIYFDESVFESTNKEGDDINE